MAKSKITFAPGSANIEASARDTVDAIAAIMKDCSDVRMEIAGYTDSQGREEMNLSLSQNRAQAVLNALLTRRILTTNLTAQGYGEVDPIADNGSEAGREANRRIEFRLLDKTATEGSDDTQAAPDAENGSNDTSANDKQAGPDAASSDSDAVAPEPDAAVDSAEPDASPFSGVDVFTPKPDDARPKPRPEQ